MRTRARYSNHKIAWDAKKMASFCDNKLTAPLSVRIKPTNRCCHGCSFCVYNKDISGMHGTFNRSDELTTEKLLDTISCLLRMGVKSVTFSGGGEPLMHPGILDAVKMAHNSKLRYSVITNGQLLCGEIASHLVCADWVRISANYYGEEEFIQSGRSSKAEDFRKIVDNVRSFAEYKEDSCELSMNYVVTRANVGTLLSAAAFWKEVGIETIRFSPVWVKDFEAYHHQIRYAAEMDIQRAINELACDTFEVQNGYSTQSTDQERKYPRCYYQEIVPVVGADANVYRCHNTAYTTHGLLGSIQGFDFEAMWKSRQLAERVYEYNPVSCSHQCAADRKNEFIEELIQCKGDPYP